MWALIILALGAVGLIALFAFVAMRSERKRGKADAVDKTQAENERRNAAAGAAERSVNRLTDNGVRDGLRPYVRDGEQ